MPNPPITVGELTDVPAPESPINAQYMQEVANRIVHRFASVAAMNGWAAANGSLAFVAPDIYNRVAGAWVMLARKTDVDNADNALSNAIASLQSQINANPYGMLARTYGANTTGIVAATEICRVSFTADPNRWYRTTIQIPALKSTASLPWAAVVDIRDNSSTVYTAGVVTVGPGEFATVSLSVLELGLLAGAHIRRLMVTAQSGGGPFDVLVGSGYFAPSIAVEDMGAV